MARLKPCPFKTRLVQSVLEVGPLEQITHPPEEDERAGGHGCEADPCQWRGKALDDINAGKVAAEADSRARRRTDLETAEQLAIRLG